MPTDYTTSAQERKEFSERLIRALSDAEQPTGASYVTRMFNAVWGGKSVSVAAVRRWLIGDAIPTQDKLRVLAYLLGTSVEWLRFGKGSQQIKLTQNMLSAADIRLLSEIKRLAPRAQKTLRELAHMLPKAGDLQ